MNRSGLDIAVHALERLIGFPSANPPGDVREINEWIAEAFGRIGCAVRVVAAEDAKPNLIIDYGDTTGPAALLFYAHSDVVGVDDRELLEWHSDPFSAHQCGDTIYGRGAVDAKSKIAALLAAMSLVAEEDVPIRRHVRIIIEADGERGDQYGIKFIKERDVTDLHSDMMIACEPSELKVLRVYKGRVWLRLVIDGRNVHSLVPDSGRNAIAEMADVLPRVLATRLSQAPAVGGDVEHEMMGGETRCCTQLHSGHALNVSPGSAEATLDIRPVFGQTTQQVVRDFRATVDHLNSLRSGLDLRLDAVEGSHREPTALDRDSPIIRAVSTAYEQALDSPVSLGTGYSVGGLQHFWDLGIPGIYFGSGGIWKAHSANESITLQELGDMADVYAQLMRHALEDKLG